MFTCSRLNTTQQITSISRRWAGQDEALRKLGRSDQLRCPYCDASLTFRHGAVTRPHFSHRKASTCPLNSDQSPEEIEAKALLFEHLEKQLGDDVALDVLLEGETRTIDILISVNGKPLYAYWLMSQIRRQMEQFVHPTDSKNIPYQIIYTQSKHQLVEDELKLQKNHSQTITHSSEFDDFWQTSLGHLIFLDTETARIRIYRGLSGGYKSLYSYEALRRSTIKELTAQPDGQLATKEDVCEANDRCNLREQQNKEEQRLQKLAREEELHRKQQQKPPEQRRWEHKQQRKDSYKQTIHHQIQQKRENQSRTCIHCKKTLTQWSIQLPGENCVCNQCLNLHNQQQSNAPFDFVNDTESTAPPTALNPTQKTSYTCECCGELTSEWSSCKPGTKTCICNACLPNWNRKIQW